MTSTRPYLIRAFFEWIVDNELTPHLVVDATSDQVTVPEEYIEDGQIVLNISPSAVQDLQLDNNWISFSARFGGNAFHLSFPPDSVAGIYARENGHGMLFPEEEPEQPPPDDDGSPEPGTKRPTLKVVK